MSKAQRNKGRRGEQEAVNLWKDLGFPFARRKLSQYQEKGGVDLENTEPFLVQVKSGQHINPWQALREVEQETEQHEYDFDSIPLAMVKKDRTGWIVLINWENFKKVVNPK